MVARDRLVLNDAQQARMSGRPGPPGPSGRDNRLVVGAVLWLVRTGAPRRALPGAFGPWNGVLRRFSRRAAAGVRDRSLAAVSERPRARLPGARLPGAGLLDQLA